MTRLDLGALAGLPEGAGPLADPRSLRTRIVHLGPGAFHRAHQAVHTEQAEALHGGGWGIAGFSQRGRSVVEQLAPQDGLYSLTLRTPDGPRTRVVGQLREALHAADDADRLRALLASPEVTVVTLTVTEKGYRRAPGGGLDTADPLVADDLAGAHVPGSVPGQLAHGLRARRVVCGAPLSVLPCDNMADNGQVVARLVREFVEASGWDDRDTLLAWIDEAVAFPSTVVDRIVPATTDADRDAASAALGVRDEAAVTGEPFTQWVLQDTFAAARPRWEDTGALLVPDVAPYQVMKLRLLNGSHTLLSCLGLADGRETVADAMTAPWAEPVLRAYAAEVAATLPPGLDADGYVDGLVDRFANPAMRHRLGQIATDGSLKVPERWLAPLRDLRAAGREVPVLTGAVAAWARHTRDHRPDDPAAGRLRAAWDGPADRAVPSLLAVLGAEDLAADPVFVAQVRDRIAALDTHGPTVLL
ncbi:mannitol dehydrogenase family protein [Streptomyces abyssomicinicus]|uniref:mannitol dehydrogenase family protein n=1 Tax=Streptomyces abyssomicinicus TaxID=574929 RepID=UPI001FE90812|nr:mannitol dehydrogenase family protein [Streptomyces abyssomicinicus]